MKLLRGITTLGLLATGCLASSQNDDLNYAIGLVNQARQAQGLQPLSWDPNLAAYAQFWANEMASGQQPFAHATGQYRPNQGENLYERASGQCDSAYENPVQTAMRAWLAQASLYNGQPITTGHEPWLHWSQCMWSTTTHIGCARAYSISEAYKVYDVCRFTPEGNVVGEKPF
ncbi:Pathogenesis-related protein 1B [Tolypocladium ophioglossoides CBS 100239]|uniref:Pathogenesis-related protein 1B n=1 Tax=Tolypocladium ophioglossoides (strain CBS 100239) TaxID=1163406 RepID=A0A0L0NMF1_TOLOC|nr:Pathogenesis-related protein 1B [Tolypocladium ophioglossoides CBS 100239]